MARNQKIAFTGPYSDINFGDYAMLVNNIYDLDINDVILFSYNDNFLNKIKSDYLQNYKIEIIEVDLGENYYNSTYDDNRTLTPIEIIGFTRNYDDIAAKLRMVNTLVVNGGGYFNSLWSMPHRIERLIKIIIPILIANQLNKNIVFTGNSYGPFGKDSELFKCFFNVLKNAVFGSRDSLYSPAWAKQIGLDDKNIKYIPDDLFVINERIQNRDNKISCPFKKYMIMEMYLTLDFIKSNIDNFKNFSNNIYDKYNLNILFMPLNTNHGGLEQAIFFDKILDNYSYIDIGNIGYLPLESAASLVKKAELVISTRYHALVLALALGTPVVSVLKDVLGDKRYYYNKNYGILTQVLKDISFDERIYLKLDYLDAMNYIAENFEEIVNKQRENYSELYIQNKEEMKKNRQDFINFIINEDKNV